MFLAWGPELVFLYNDAYAEILSCKHPAALGGRFPEIWREIWTEVEPIVSAAMAGNASFHENAKFSLFRNGRYEDAWFVFSYSPLLGPDNTISGMFCVCSETTEQVLAAQHRAEENKRLRDLFKQAPGVIAHLVGEHHVIELCNDSMLRLVGRVDVQGMKVREALPELAGQGYFELLDKVYQSGEPFLGSELPVQLQRTPNAPLEQRFVSFIFQPTYDHRGKVSGVFVEGSDVTDAVRAAATVRENEQRLRELANTIPQLAWMADADGLVRWYNDRWYEYTGTTCVDMVNMGWGSLIHIDDVAHADILWKQSISSGELFQVKARIRSAGGTYNMFFIRAAALRDEGGKVLRWFGTNTDVTPLQIAQSELKEANARKDEYLAMLAHELRNPLAPIATAAELLKKAQPNPMLVERTSTVIARQVNHMTELLDDLLDVSRVTRGLINLKIEVLNVSETLRDAIEQSNAHIVKKNQQLLTDIPLSPSFVTGDQTRLIQIFANLLNNASKYTGTSGKIFLRLTASKETVTIEIRDTGIGMSQSLLPHVFELFAQGERSPDRSQGGLGLGLSLVKSLVELQGGHVTAHSEGAGKGSTFRVQLPRAYPAGISLDEGDVWPEPEPSSIPNAALLSVLIVDDNVDAADTLGLLLDAVGYTVSVAHGSAAALEQARLLSPNVMFLDIGLPDMDGYQLARTLRQRPETAECYLVALTGYGQPGDIRKALDAGFDRHMTKPVNLSLVLDLLKNELEKTSSPR
jgi:PAS domain S-box-containing protein